MDLVWYARRVSALSREVCFRLLPSGRELLMAKYRDFTHSRMVRSVKTWLQQLSSEYLVRRK